MSSYVKNPQQKTQLVELLFHGTQPSRGKPQGVLGDALHSLQFSKEHLMNALMNFYIGTYCPEDRGAVLIKE